MRKICCFSGHSELYDTNIIYKNIIYSVEKLITDNDIREFWVGDYGAFDRLASKAVRELKGKYTEIQLKLVIPYITKRINDNKEIYYKDYDDIFIADIPEKTPHKLQIIKCNQYMINNSAFLICYVEHSYGGASKTLEFAKKNEKLQIINLAEKE